MQKAKQGYGERPCWECGKTFYARAANKVFCSEACQREYNKRRSLEKRRREWEENPRYCPCCGEVVPFGRRIYCSKACQIGMKRKESVQIESEAKAKRIKRKEPGIEARAKALGMSYGQYRATGGKKPEDIAEKYKAPAYSEGGWLGSKTVDINQPPPGGPVKIRVRVKRDALPRALNNQ